MYKHIAVASFAACIALSKIAQCQEIPRTELNLASYTCQKFLDDATHPDEPQKLIRALMLVSWAAGFAASGEHSGPHADVPTLKLITASLKLMCKLKPKEFAISVFVENTSKYITR
jgi:hypothetical protein